MSHPLPEVARGRTDRSGSDEPSPPLHDNQRKGSFRLKAAHGLLVLVAIVGFVAGTLIGHLTSETPMASLPEAPPMAQCVADTSKLFGQKDGPRPEVYRQARDHCYSMIHSHQLFNDAAVRKLNFFQQYRANGVLMWTVVAVTFAGVLLAGLQLWASYQLAAANRTALHANDGEFILRRDQLVLKSSITGLFILLISSCLFLVFVTYVYRFEIPADRGSSIVVPPVPTLPMGGLGPPPDKEKSQ
jgi:hypothetical protein